MAAITELPGEAYLNDKVLLTEMLFGVANAMVCLFSLPHSVSIHSPTGFTF